jgi:hypothetical protein
MNDITAWLNGPRNYAEGLELYNKHGHSPSLKRILTISGDTKRNAETLAYELSKISATLHIEPVKIQIKKPVLVKPVIEYKPIPTIDRNNADIQTTIEAKNRLYKQYVALFHQLEHLQQPDRLKAALDCLTIMDEVQRLWGIIDYHRQHGALPPVTISVSKENKVNEMDKADLLQYRNNSLRPAISQLKKKLTNAKGGAKRAELQDQIDKKELLLRQVELKIQTV